MDALVVLGPTAVGKTEVGILLAEALNGEIISCDSMQIYQGMDIGTAKPTEAERRRAVFHLIDIVPPDAYYSAASFQADARAAIEKVRAGGRLPIIVGGTGLYLRALLEGFTIPPSGRNDAIRRRLEEEAERSGLFELHERLKQADPPTAARLSPNDRVRIIRALEVFEATGAPISAQQGRDPLPLRVRRFGLFLQRDRLVERIERRVDRMMQDGWLDEVRRLLDRGFSPDLPSMRSLGYRHLSDYLLGATTEIAPSVERIKIDTRRFAKRQMTWFRKEPEVTWLDTVEGPEQVASEIVGAVHRGGSR